MVIKGQKAYDAMLQLFGNIKLMHTSYCFDSGHVFANGAWLEIRGTDKEECAILITYLYN
jgi:hypothetical protein